MTTCIRCLINDKVPGVTFDKNGMCSFCTWHDLMESEYGDYRNLFHKMDVIRRDGIGRKYDCLIGISGGVDSTFLAWSAVHLWGLRPLLIHFDNTWNTTIAENNMLNLVNATKSDLVRYRYDVNKINKDFLMAGVHDLDIPNDIAMGTLMNQEAQKQGIKWIFNGHDFRCEGTCPVQWTYMDGKYIESVCNGEIGTYPNLWLLDQLRTGFSGIKHIRPFYYYPMSKKERRERMIKEVGFEYYGACHNENRYTSFVGYYLLPKRWGIDKRILYASAEMRSGFCTRSEAQKELKRRDIFDKSIIKDVKERLNITPAEWEHILNGPKKTFQDFKTYHKHFMRWKRLYKFLANVGFLPRTFVKKYTQEVKF